MTTNSAAAEYSHGSRFEWVLRITTAAQAIGLGWAEFSANSLVAPAIRDLFNILPQTYEPLSSFIAALLITTGLLILARPTWFVLLPLLLWQAFITGVFTYLNQGNSAFLIPFKDAVRFMAPIALGLYISLSKQKRLSSKRMFGIAYLMRIATGLTFLVFALRAYGGDEHLIIFMQSLKNLVNPGLLSESLAMTVSRMFAGIEVMLVALFLLRKWEWVPVILAILGFLIAGSQLAAFGLAGGHEVLIRLPAGGIPLAVYFHWRRQ